jgi:hypothetical protein
MEKPELGDEGKEALEQVLGYLNFSSGSSDPQFLTNLSSLYEALDTGEDDLWEMVGKQLRNGLEELHGKSPALSDIEQATGVLKCVFEGVLPEFLKWHRNLLFHQVPGKMYNAFFVGRVCEAVLRQGGPWDEDDRIVRTAIRELNDFLGHRPVPALETQRTEPYPHEFVRPVPLYVRGAGPCYGRHRAVVELALELLNDTDEALLRSAYFDPDLLDELAYDPRAYDFEHPVNKRPNYHFGQWDAYHVDRDSRYRRFVVQEVTLDALMCRMETEEEVPAEELLFEAAAVLAGTMLMASGISGSGPDTHDSESTLATLLPNIAAYRDQFYKDLFGKMSGEHAERLTIEAAERRQPFGAARQHLNAQLARRRASQLEHVHLSKIFARMGYLEAARDEASVVATTSARILADIDCSLASGHRSIDSGDLDAAVDWIDHIQQQLLTGIQCGAIVDPWNILGFDAQYSLFPAMENTVRDHRVDELLDIIEQFLAFCSRIWSEAAAADNESASQSVATKMKDIAEWWFQFAAHEVENVETIDSMKVFHAAEHVAQALNLWHKAGAEAGDVKFWAPYADMFNSPKAYALVIQALLDHGDFVASMALLIHWVGQAERVGMERGTSSFYVLMELWLCQLLKKANDPEDREESQKLWVHVRRLFDYLEANADEYWHPPTFDLGTAPKNAPPPPAANSMEPLFDDDGAEGDVFGAAYEDMVYRDSTDDGMEGEIFDDEDATHDELLHHSKYVADRLAFLSCLARLWKNTAIHFKLAEVEGVDFSGDSKLGDWSSALARWGKLAFENEERLCDLSDTVRDYKVPPPSGDHESMLEYDRRQMVKETLLERIIYTTVETGNARLLLLAAGCNPSEEGEFKPVPNASEEEQPIVWVLSGILLARVDFVQQHWESLGEKLADQPLLYVPLTRGGEPRTIVTARSRQLVIQDLLSWLPRCGCIVEACDLIDLARTMERDNPVGPGAITEFDELFKIGYKAIVRCLVESALDWPVPEPEEIDTEETVPTAESDLVALLEKLTEALLISWLSHSRTLRLSVLERLHDDNSWQKVVEFVTKYGEDLFTQRFLNLGNLRAILHQQPAHWLQQIKELYPDLELKLMDDVGESISFVEAGEMLGLVLEAIVENYGEYRDYNSTTTQSDSGNLLFTLLDFLRLRTKYDRVCWNLKPVTWAHAILVRNGNESAARMWRRSLRQRINEEADSYLRQLSQLQKKYAMRMPTVADRLAERFVRPMAIDRICALVQHAMRESACDGDTHYFELLRHETDLLTRDPTGVGLDVPAWLVALEDEVDRVRVAQLSRIPDDYFRKIIPQFRLTKEEVQDEIDEWTGEE